MNKPSRIGLVHALLAVFALTILGQAVRVQIVQGEGWRVRAQRQQYREKEVPAPRGPILDASGRVLAESREVVRLEVAPREITDAPKLRRGLAAAGVTREWISRALDRKRAWVTIPGRFVALEVASLSALRGVYTTPVSLRSYAMSDGARAIIGRVDANGKPVDGLELALDSVLSGTPGSSTLLRDVRGSSMQSPSRPGIPARPGNAVRLTINQELQEISERALGDAVSAMQADGGDIVILDPHSGEVLAMASRRAGGATGSASAITEPFEPGSTMKPFIAAGLLQRGRVTDRDSVDTGDGVIKIAGREIHDEHRIGRAPLSEVLRWSSNVGIVKFAQRFTPREQFETLRDFGFGTATGVTYPSEANGTLREPARWSQQSAASLAIGYEIAATPLQLASAYAVFANGGKLLEPSLVKEIRAPDGRVTYRHEPRVVRQVIPPGVADRMRVMLMNVVENGTAVQADISNYLMAGKTGTPRRTVGGRYAAMQYNPNFVGLFPGDRPQYVIVVKLTNPSGTYYGGTTAAPVTKAVLQAAIAARDAALDRGKLASAVHPASSVPSPSAIAPAPHESSERAGTQLALRTDTVDAGTSAGRERPREADYVPDEPIVVKLPQIAARIAPPATPRPVPDVRGMSLREAVRSLHSAGFRVQLGRMGPPGASEIISSPSAGSIAPAGSMVRLQFDR
jgi:cell division protein FtsI (penicillin-binding protein 3)